MATSTIKTSVLKNFENKKSRIIRENVFLVWVDANIDENEPDYQNTLSKLFAVVNRIEIFRDVDSCVDFLEKVSIERVMLITSGALGKELVERIHWMNSIANIFVFCQNVLRHQKWAADFPIVTGVFDDITSICENLQQAVRQTNQDAIPISFLQSDYNENSIDSFELLEPTFYFTRSFKKILLRMKLQNTCREPLIKMCRETYAKNENYLELLNKFDREYKPRDAIWWYTYQTFIYPLINGAFRFLAADIIVNAAFYIQDLHCQLKELQQKERRKHKSQASVLYRGQKMLHGEFSTLKKSVGKLIAFNSFLSTSTDKNVAKEFATKSIDTSRMIGVIFIMEINNDSNSVPFAAVDQFSAYPWENEVLFSMNATFHVKSIGEKDNKGICEVYLNLLGNEHPVLKAFDRRLDKDFIEGKEEEDLAHLLMKTGHSNKAEEIYLTLLNKKTTDESRMKYYHFLGSIYQQRGDYDQALEYCSNQIKICQRVRTSNHPDLAMSYIDQGKIYNSMANYRMAFEFYEKAKVIYEKISVDHSAWINLYHNIGLVYSNQEKFSKALSYFELALTICRDNHLPENHPDFATVYNSIGLMYCKEEKYEKALIYCEKALKIQIKILPNYHPNLGNSYSNLGLVHCKVGNYSKALSYYEKALLIDQKTLPALHRSLANSYTNTGQMHNRMGDYSTALSYFHKAKEIQDSNDEVNNEDFITSCANIAQIYSKMGEYSKALSSYKEAYFAYVANDHLNDHLLATLYNNMGSVYNNMNNYSKALENYLQAVKIHEKISSKKDLSLAAAYNNIGLVYNNMEHYSMALSYYNKALEIRRSNLPEYHADFAVLYINIGLIHNNMGHYTDALKFLDDAEKIYKRQFSENHPDLANLYNNKGSVYEKMEKYLTTLEYYEKALKIRKQHVNDDHISLANSYSRIGQVHYYMNEFSKSLLSFKKALSIQQKTLGNRNSSIQTTLKWIATVEEKLDDE